MSTIQDQLEDVETTGKLSTTSSHSMPLTSPTTIFGTQDVEAHPKRSLRNSLQKEEELVELHPNMLQQKSQKKSTVTSS